MTLEEVLAWLRDAAVWIGSLDWAAIATLITALVTAFVAMVTRRQVRLTQDIERSRRAEFAISHATPLSAWLDEDWLEVMGEGRPILVLRVRIKNVGDELVSAISGVLRSDEKDASEPANRDALVPNQEYVLEFNLVPFVTAWDGVRPRTELTHLEVVLISRGLLNQRVIQNYRLDFNRAVDDYFESGMSGAPGEGAWYQERLQVVPGDEGVHSTDIHFVP